jgi:hypothetical protein
MATWTTIPNAAVAVGGIPSSTTVQAFRDNPVAIAESASGAPVVFSGWHPVDKVSVGDGKTGLIYSHAVNGTVATVVTPDFEDGYEYRIIGRDLTHDDASNNRTLTVQGFYETAAAYRDMVSSTGLTSTGFFGCDYEILTPRISARAHLVRSTTYANGNVNTGTGSSDSYITTAQKLTRARITFRAGSNNITGGQIWFFRRREYATLD